MVVVDKVLGFVDFDEKASPEGDRRIAVNIREDMVSRVFRGKYVYIHSSEGRVFFGRIVSGPFYRPEGLAPDSLVAKAFTIRGEFFERPPPYYAVFVVELLGEVKGGRLEASYTKPRPLSRVYEVPVKETERMLGFRGDMVLGHLLGYKGIKVRFDPGDPNFLPRNVGVFGTVGSGKTNTAQVLAEEAVRAGWSVFILDVEGEYTFMDVPNSDEKMVSILQSVFDMRPQGIEDFKVYVPVGRSSTRSDARSFSVPFEDLDIYVFSEIIMASEPQQRYLSEILDRMREEFSEDSGEGFEDIVVGGGRSRITLRDVRYRVDRESDSAERFKKTSLLALNSKIDRLLRLGVFDRDVYLPVRERMVPGALTVIDLSDTEDVVKNIIIAWLLYKVFSLKLSGVETKTMVIIEEAHTFVSKEARDKMAATIDMLKLIARRGRKRWLSLVFVSQQPGHLPPEVFELCNTRIVHSLRSEINLEAIRKTSGGVTRENIRDLSMMSTGEALLVSPAISFPQKIKVRPAMSLKKRF